MGSSADAGGAVDVDPDVALVSQLWLAGVDPHPDGNLECALRLLGRRQRVRGAGEDDEEGVALGVDLDPAVAFERLAEDAAVLAQDVGIALAELVEEPGRALDVGEDEGDGPGGKWR